MYHLRKGQAYRPLPDSPAEDMIVWLKLKGIQLGSADLAGIADVSASQVGKILRTAVKYGLVDKGRDGLGNLLWSYAGPADIDWESGEHRDADSMIQRHVSVDQAQPIAICGPNSVFDFGRYIHDCQA